MNCDDDILDFMADRLEYKDSQIIMMVNSLGQFYIGSIWCYNLELRKDGHQKYFEIM